MLSPFQIGGVRKLRLSVADISYECLMMFVCYLSVCVFHRAMLIHNPHGPRFLRLYGRRPPGMWWTPSCFPGVVGVAIWEPPSGHLCHGRPPLRSDNTQFLGPWLSPIPSYHISHSPANPEWCEGAIIQQQQQQPKMFVISVKEAARVAGGTWDVPTKSTL